MPLQSRAHHDVAVRQATAAIAQIESINGARLLRRGRCGAFQVGNVGVNQAGRNVAAMPSCVHAHGPAHRTGDPHSPFEPADPRRGALARESTGNATAAPAVTVALA